jgi:predicted transcriptional regulator
LCGTVETRNSDRGYISVEKQALVLLLSSPAEYTRPLEYGHRDQTITAIDAGYEVLMVLLL